MHVAEPNNPITAPVDSNCFIYQPVNGVAECDKLEGTHPQTKGLSFFCSLDAHYTWPWDTHWVLMYLPDSSIFRQLA